MFNIYFTYTYCVRLKFFEKKNYNSFAFKPISIEIIVVAYDF